DLKWAIIASQHRSLRQAADVLNIRQSTPCGTSATSRSPRGSERPSAGSKLHWKISVNARTPSLLEAPSRAGLLLTSAVPQGEQKPTSGAQARRLKCGAAPNATPIAHNSGPQFSKASMNFGRRRIRVEQIPWGVDVFGMALALA